MTSEATDRGTVVERRDDTPRVVERRDDTPDVLDRRDDTQRVAAAPAVVTTGATGVSTAAMRDRVRWGPILAGLLTAIASFLLLGLAAAAIGLNVAQGGTDTATAGNTSAIVAAIIGLVVFFIGGYVAASTAALARRSDGALNGFLVWALAILVILVLAGIGVGQAFGPTGGALGAYRVDAGGSVDLNTLRTSALGAFLGMLLPALAATIGGFVGARPANATATATYTERA